MFVMPFAHASVRPVYRPVVPSLAQVIDRLFDDTVVPTQAVRTPALDVEETDTHYLLSFDLPGAAKEALKVSVEGRRVQVETEEPVQPATVVQPAPQAQAPEATATEVVPAAGSSVAPAAPQAAPRSLYRERSTPRYARTVSLPSEVDSDASEARFENGVLTLRLAKRRIDGARRLTIA